MSAPAPIAFPADSICGAIGELAGALASGEVPKQFVWAAALTALGAHLSGKVRLANAVGTECRLYTVLVGESSAVKKSTAIKRAIEFFDRLPNPDLRTMAGAGSAEGLAAAFKDTPGILLAYDELLSFANKISIQGSTLLPLVSALFEQRKWENQTINHSLLVENAQLSFLGACTREGYESLWGQDALAIGLHNRILLVHADALPRTAWPPEPDPARIEALRSRIAQQIAALPPEGRVYDIEPDARAAWTAWYEALPRDEYSRRLDTIGFRLMMLLAFTCDKPAVDLETVQRVTAVLNYEHEARRKFDSINVGDRITGMEERIRRVLVDGPCGKRHLQQRTNASRHGTWVFRRAIENLITDGQIARQHTLLAGREVYVLVAEAEAA